MANPTTNYGWTLPVEGQDPYFEVLDDVFSAIDTRVHSVEIALATRATLVMSIHPTASNIFKVNSSTYIDTGGDGLWTVGSATPYGNFIGSFSMINSGAYATFDMRVTGYFSAAAGGFNNPSAVRFRLVVSNDTGVRSMVIPNNSSWIMKISQELTHLPESFLTVVPLNPGHYVAELQATNIPLTQSSQFNIDKDDSIKLVVLETRQ